MLEMRGWKNIESKLFAKISSCLLFFEWVNSRATPADTCKGRKSYLWHKDICRGAWGRGIAVMDPGAGIVVKVCTWFSILLPQRMPQFCVVPPVFFHVPLLSCLSFYSIAFLLFPQHNFRSCFPVQHNHHRVRYSLLRNPGALKARLLVVSHWTNTRERAHNPVIVIFRWPDQMESDLKVEQSPCKCSSQCNAQWSPQWWSPKQH